MILPVLKPLLAAAFLLLVAVPVVAQFGQMGGWKPFAIGEGSERVYRAEGMELAGEESMGAIPGFMAIDRPAADCGAPSATLIIPMGLQQRLPAKEQGAQFNGRARVVETGGPALFATFTYRFVHFEGDFNGYLPLDNFQLMEEQVTEGGVVNLQPREVRLLDVLEPLLSLDAEHMKIELTMPVDQGRAVQFREMVFPAEDFAWAFWAAERDCRLSASPDSGQQESIADQWPEEPPFPGVPNEGR